ncbi:pilus assembly protein N-terminal domain-containing protein [Orbus sturtevantii]|uniref:type II and III secretion system protein family protein n=1 Tax=Orbus sturtevantii TaxID=3074109 RepID=UPI00370D09AF
MSLLTLHKYYKQALSLSITLLLMGVSSSALATTYYLQPGQSKTINLSNKIHTIFIAKDSVANYEVVGDKSIIIYAKKDGLTSLTAYDENDNIILNDTINVDPILSQVIYRIKQDFPNSNINISKYAAGGAGERFTYVLSGNVPDSETKNRILDFTGAMIGTGQRSLKVDSYGSENDHELEFLQKKLYDNIIDKIEVVQETQVNVKLTFVEVSKAFTNALGIEWQSLTLESMMKNESNINSVGEFTLLGLKKGFDINNITTAIRAIDSDKLAKVLAEPNLSVLSGETASFLVGGEIPILVASKDNEANTIEYKEFGIKLNIGAKVYNGKRIRLFVANEFSSLSGNYQYNDYNIPTLSTRKTSSTVDVADGDSFVIAGLINEKDSESLTKIPFLGDIPILGALARSTITQREKTELVVFVTVNLVTPNNSFNGVELPIFERTNSTNLFFNINSNFDKQKEKTLPISNESEKFVNYMGFIE